MCLVAISYKQNKEFPLIMLANRDEFYDRPSKRVHFWEDHPDIYAGRDVERGGTWLGVTKSGRFACVTNIREPLNETEDHEFISRGELVRGFLSSTTPAKEYVESIRQQKDDFQGFNLIAGTIDEVYYYSNRLHALQKLTPGNYYVSNSTLNVTWPKIDTLKTAVETEIMNETAYPALIDKGLHILQSTMTYPDHVLPDTGVGLELERLLSPVFIQSETYGTRVSTIVLFDKDGKRFIAEQGYGENGVQEERIEKIIHRNA
ncbi:NRDE family protein [Alkalihalophilus pseudofirmus]|uniref:NRDE family protein n=1 Tax=Alkalihalophilus pseudofirmus TaxID=79885 RepID=UPI00259B7EEB|nr:NRDE family protein [Alkalihalophilus pseudofirmus]WEG18416.1 NRDE family protein [Alkalihalophilus pseudofirmus]